MPSVKTHCAQSAETQIRTSVQLHTLVLYSEVYAQEWKSSNNLMSNLQSFEHRLLKNIHLLWFLQILTICEKQITNTKHRFSVSMSPLCFLSLILLRHTVQYLHRAGRWHWVTPFLHRPFPAGAAGWQRQTPSLWAVRTRRCASEYDWEWGRRRRSWCPGLECSGCRSSESRQRIHYLFSNSLL